MSRKLGLGGVKPLVVLAPGSWKFEYKNTECKWIHKEHTGTVNGYKLVDAFCLGAGESYPSDKEEVYTKDPYFPELNKDNHIFESRGHSLSNNGVIISAYTSKPIKINKYNKITITYDRWENYSNPNSTSGIRYQNCYIEFTPENNSYSPVKTDEESYNDTSITYDNGCILLSHENYGLKPEENEESTQTYIIPKEAKQNKDGYYIWIKCVNPKTGGNNRTNLWIKSITLE